MKNIVKQVAGFLLQRAPIIVAIAVVITSMVTIGISNNEQALTASRLTSMKLLFDDEFNGTNGSLPNSSRWNIETGDPGSGNQELECYTNSSKNVHLDGQGHLDITALYAPNTPCGSGVTQSYTSARLDTYQHFSSEHGIIAMSAKLPTAQGMWPAFWAMGNGTSATGWPNNGEIDTMEAIGSDTGTETVHGTIHGPYVNAPEFAGTGWQESGTGTASSDLSSTYHTYDVVWSPGTISFQVDGSTYYTISKSNIPAGDQWVFDTQPFYLLMNLAVGGDWAGAPDAKTIFPQTMSVDWVRVYSN
jgi:beta-glucanase (GH16 family)